MIFSVLNTHRTGRRPSHPGTLSAMVFAAFFAIVVMPAFAVLNGQSVSTAFTLPSANQTGTPEGGSFEGAMETINLQNGNVAITLPLLHLPGVAGNDLDLKLLINSKVYKMIGGLPPHYDTANARNEYTPPGFAPPRPGTQVFFAGGQLNIASLTSNYVSLTTTSTDSMGIPTTLLAQCNAGYTFFDPSGVAHGFGNLSGCMGDAHPTNPEINYSESSDGAFYRLDTTNSSDAVVYDRSGVQYHFKSNGVQTIVDPSGNTISISSSGYYPNTTYAITDTVGHQVTVTSSSITYYDSNGTQQTISATATDLGSQPVQFTQNGGSSEDGQYGYVYAGTENFNTPTTRYALSFPTGEQFQLTYSGFAEITKIQYPSGGYTSYLYQSIPGTYIDSNWQIYADMREIQTKSVCSNSSGSCSSQDLVTTTYTPHSGGDANDSMEVLDPVGNLTHVDFYANTQAPGGIATVEKQRFVYAGSGSAKQLLRTIAYVYAGNGTPDSCRPNPTSVTTTLNDASPNLSSRIEYDYQALTLSDDTYTTHECGTAVQSPNVVTKREYDFDGSLIRTTSNSWLASTTAAPHLLDRISGTTISTAGFQSTHGRDYTGTGLLQAETFSGTNATSGTITYGHDLNGRLTSVQDARLNTTTYNYTPSWANTNASCNVSLSPSPTLTTDAVNHSTLSTIDACTGTLHRSTDANGNATTFGYDAILRRTSQSNPDGGGTVLTYSASRGTNLVTSQALNSGHSLTSVIVHDGIGRVAQKQNISDPGGTVSVDYAYDPNGAVHSISNPHYSNSATNSTIIEHDALGRPTVTTNADQVSTRHEIYLGNIVQVCDEASSCRKLSYDAIGRLVSVAEQTTDFGGFCVGHGGCQSTDINTLYAYDAVGNLKSVNQGGSVSRSFSFDGLSRLISANNPETGMVCYGVWISGNCVGQYDGNGNLLAKTDARGLTTTYTYDVLNRLTAKSFSDGTKAQYYGYDGKGTDGRTLQSPFTTNSIGRLSETSDLATVSSLYSYDPMGRVAQQQDVNGGTTTTTSSIYDLAGNVTSLTYPNGRTIATKYDSAGGLSEVHDGTANGPQYAGLSYYADRSLNTMTLGASGLSTTRRENSRLQTCAAQATLGRAIVYSRTYSFTPSGGGSCGEEAGNNGTIWQIQDAIGSSSQAMQYDSLSRLKSWDAPNMASAVRHINYGYDSFGNMMSDRGYSPAPSLTGVLNNSRPFPNSNYDASNWPYDTNNRLVDGTFDCAPATGTAHYDGAGNVLCDGSSNAMNAHQYVWDAESHIVQVNAQPGSGTTYYKAAIYTYDAAGQRVRADQFTPADPSHSTWRQYYYFGNQVLAELDNTGNWTDYIYADGKQIARVEPTFHQIRTWGTNPTNGCSELLTTAGFGGINYKLKQGDVLEFDQKNASTVGGLLITLANTVNNAFVQATDQHGIPINSQTDTSGQWVHRTFDLSSASGQTIAAVWPIAGGPAGPWVQSFGDIAIHSLDGLVVPIFTGQQVSGSPYSSCNAFSYLDSSAARVDSASTQQATKYLVADDLGTAKVEVNGTGTPIWMGEFAPFGQELDSGITSNRYKFTGKERDTESGLDYFGARYYGSNMGRFMSPDDGTDQHPDDPQSWNLYTYGRNNPLVFTDPTGHSTQTAANGDVLAVYDDKDLGVYRHGDIDNRKDWDGSKLDDTDPQTSKMGQTERWGEFANWNSKNPDGISGSAAPGAFIHFGQSIDSTIQSLNAQSNKQALSSTAIDSTHGGSLDIKTGSMADHGVYTGYLLNGNYASIRSAGNFLAGLNAMTGTFAGSHISPQFAQKLFGAYQAGGKSGLAYTLTTGKAYPGTSAPYWGEENYSGYMQQKGINAGAQK